MPKLVQDFIPKSNGNRPGFAMTPEYITVHETGNRSAGANAEMHGRFIKNPSTAASWHITVDDGDVAIQHLPFNENGWHCGDGRDGTGNRKSIGIEICVNSDGDFEKAKQNAAFIIRDLMDRFNIPMSKVVQHWDWSRKNCPQNIRANEGFPAFKQRIPASVNAAPTKPAAKPAPKPSGKSIDQLADEVIAGKHGTGDARKKSLGSQFAAVQARVNEKLGAKPKPAAKTNAQLAQEVIDGKWGNNPQRNQRLNSAGHNASAVQAEVNRILGGGKSTASNRKSIDQLAREVINGKWGNNPQRSQRLKAAGYDANAVQRRVNQLL